MLATCCSLHTLGPKRKFVELGSMFSEPSPFPSLILPEAQFCQHLMRSNISVPPPLAQNNGSGALTQQRPILQITGGGSAGQPGTLGPSEGLIPLPPDQYLLLVHSLQSSHSEMLGPDYKGKSYHQSSFTHTDTGHKSFLKV